MKLQEILLCAVLGALTGCAAEVTRHPTSLSTSGIPTGKTYSVVSEVVYTLDSGRRRIVHAGMKFTDFGSIPQGKVFKPVDSVLVIGGAHHHEAYAVIDGDMLKGFYLPVEKAFSPLPNPVPISLKEK